MQLLGCSQDKTKKYNLDSPLGGTDLCFNSLIGAKTQHTDL